jgi:hypothetical protein
VHQRPAADEVFGLEVGPVAPVTVTAWTGSSASRRLGVELARWDKVG